MRTKLVAVWPSGNVIGHVSMVTMLRGCLVGSKMGNQLQV